jgi:hypothetical protein
MSAPLSIDDDAMRPSNVVDLVPRLIERAARKASQFVPGRTEDDAAVLLEFFMDRTAGWFIVLGMDPVRGCTDGRTRRAKQADTWFRDMGLNSPGFDALRAAAIRGEDLADQWPESFRPALRFQLRHAVPRPINEPLSEENRKHRTDVQGMPAWPSWLDAYAEPARVEDHPPCPEPSPLYQAWRSAWRRA